MLAIAVAPGERACGLRMSKEIKDLDISFPDGEPIEHFMDEHGFAVDRPAIVQLFDGQSGAVDIAPITHPPPHRSTTVPGALVCF